MREQFSKTTRPLDPAQAAQIEDYLQTGLDWLAEREANFRKLGDEEIERVARRPNPFSAVQPQPQPHYPDPVCGPSRGPTPTSGRPYQRRFWQLAEGAGRRVMQFIERRARDQEPAPASISFAARLQANRAQTDPYRSGWQNTQPTPPPPSREVRILVPKAIAPSTRREADTDPFFDLTD